MILTSHDLNSPKPDIPTVPFRTNVIYRGDCEKILVNPDFFPDNSVDLIYIDPPFFTNRDHEIIWNDGAEVRAFEDRWRGGSRGIENYIAWMEPTVLACQRVLKPTGSFYLHCDWHANYKLRELLNRAFGESSFQNEIVWKRTSGHTGEGEVKRYGAVHDTLFFYTKGREYTFNREYQPYDDSYTDRFYRFQDSDGRRYTMGDLTGAGIRHGATGKPWKGVSPTQKGRHWIRPPPELDKWEREGRIIWPKNGGVPRYKRYLDEMPGVLLQDVWLDIKPTQAHSEERIGYPTQKPVSLLERIVRASSNPLDVILDPMCGCGTAIAAAHKLGRRWIGIDIAASACKIMYDRMRKLGAEGVELIGMPRTLEELRTLHPRDFQNWVCQALTARISPTLSNDKGVDGRLFDGSPIQVKRSDNIGRNIVDNFEPAMRRVRKNHGVIVAFSFTPGAYEEAARAQNEEGLNIELRKVEDILNQERAFAFEKHEPKKATPEATPKVAIRAKPKKRTKGTDLEGYS